MAELEEHCPFTWNAEGASVETHCLSEVQLLAMSW